MLFLQSLPLLSCCNSKYDEVVKVFGYGDIWLYRKAQTLFCCPVDAAPELRSAVDYAFSKEHEPSPELSLSC